MSYKRFGGHSTPGDWHRAKLETATEDQRDAAKGDLEWRINAEASRLRDQMQRLIEERPNGNGKS